MTVCYFTATGNCLYVAKRISGEALSIPQLMKQDRIELTDDAVGIVCPVYGGEMTRVHLEVANELVGVMIDRFGKEIPIMKTDENHFKTSVDVTFSNQFLGWTFALGDKVKIIGPETAVKQMKVEAKRLAKQYR